MTDQPQPAADLIRDVQATLDDLATYSETLTAPGLIDALAYHGVRLARADAPGVTFTVDESAVVMVALANSISACGKPECDCCRTTKLAYDKVRAALADAEPKP